MAGLCLILAPALFSVTEVLSGLLPEGGNDPVAQLSATGSQRGIWLWATFVGIASAIFFIPALFGLMQMIRARGVVLAHVGGAFAIVGSALAGLVLGGFQLVLYDMASPANDRHAMVAAVQHATHDPALLPIVASHDVFALGIVLLGIAAWRSRLAGRVAGLLVVAAVLVDVIAGSILSDSIAVTIVSDGLLVVGLGAIGVRLLPGSDAIWDAGVTPSVEAPTPVVARG